MCWYSGWHVLRSINKAAKHFRLLNDNRIVVTDFDWLQTIVFYFRQLITSFHWNKFYLYETFMSQRKLSDKWYKKINNFITTTRETTCALNILIRSFYWLLWCHAYCVQFRSINISQHSCFYLRQKYLLN